MPDHQPSINAIHLNGDQLRMQVRGHVLFADQPVSDGGDDTAPTPTEIFLAGLTGCVAFYAQRFLRRSGISTLGLRVDCDYEWAEHPHRVGEIRLAVTAPGLPAERRDAFLRVIEHCSVHNTLAHPPAIEIRLDPRERAVA